MYVLSNLIFLSVFFSVAVMLAYKGLSMKVNPQTEKVSPFECGFNPHSKSPKNFSLQFFLVTLIFLIFDMELILLFPYIPLSQVASSQSILLLLFFLLILSGGFFWEWEQGMLDWAY